MDHREAGPVAAPKNRYLSARRNLDWTIDQDWESYSEAEHNRWNRLYARQCEVLKGRACDAFLHAMERLKLSDSGVPDMARLSDRLEPLTGWRVVPVTELVPDAVFFDHLANRRFPAGAFIRPEAEMDYLQEPDVFHDVFGHVPLLADPVYADFMRAYGEAGARAVHAGALPRLARLYWYTVEFGLIRSSAGLRLFGAGIMSSASESVYALEDPTPLRVAFDLERVMRTRYVISEFQRIYFVIDDFAALLTACEAPFAPIYARLADQPDVPPGASLAGDEAV